MLLARAHILLLVTLWGSVQGATFEADRPANWERIAPVNEQLYRDLQSLVCEERVERFRGHLDSGQARHVDTLTAHVSFENGAEHYADVRRNQQAIAGFSGVSGAWSEGEFGTLLRQTIEMLSDGRAYEVQQADWEGEPVAIVRLAVSAQSSPWRLVLEGDEARAVAFEVSVWISKGTGRIVHVVRRVTDLPASAGISEIEWAVSLRTQNVRDGAWLVPDSGEYSVSYAALNRRESNRIYFSNYRRYGSETTIHYGE